MRPHNDHLVRLVEHLDWANRRALASLRDSRTPLSAAISLYAHVIGAEHVWLSRLSGKTPEVAVWPEISLDECERLARANVDELRKIVESVSPEALDRPVTYRNSAGKEFTNRVEDILLHVAMHGSYHRGQVAAMLRSAGDEPNPTDYIQWVRGVAAATHPPKD